MKFRFVNQAVGVFLLLGSVMVTSASATEFFASAPPDAQDSLLLSARPGEYYYNLGADAVRHKDYTHAIQMYEVSASWGYKTAEYNLAIMYARGEGVVANAPRAMAWMSLAAERNVEKYTKARDLIASQLDQNGLAEAEAILRELVPTYGDAVALKRAKQRWREVREGATGSHLGDAGHVEVGGSQRRYIATPSKDGVILTKEAAMKSSQDIVGASSVDGSVAYAALRDTDDPYDPKFSQGRAEVGVPQPIVQGKTSAPVSESQDDKPKQQ